MISKLQACSTAIVPLLMACAPASAQTAASPAVDPARVAAAQELADVLDLKTMIRAANEAAVGQVEAQVLAATLKADPRLQDIRMKDPARFDAALQRVVAIVTGELKKMNIAMEPDVYREGVAIYARVYTAEEMREITGFYRSPVGAKMLAKQPEIIRESMAMAQRLLVGRMPAFLQQIKGQIEEEVSALKAQAQ